MNVYAKTERQKYEEIYNIMGKGKSHTNPVSHFFHEFDDSLNNSGLEDGIECPVHTKTWLD